jgi:hypothetical protein
VSERPISRAWKIRLNETKLYDRISLSGLISGQNLYLEPLIGPIYITGAIEYPLTGNILGYTGIYITGTYCDDVFTSSGDIALDINLNYLCKNRMNLTLIPKKRKSVTFK